VQEAVEVDRSWRLALVEEVVGHRMKALVVVEVVRTMRAWAAAVVADLRTKAWAAVEVARLMLVEEEQLEYLEEEGEEHRRELAEGEAEGEKMQLVRLVVPMLWAVMEAA